MGGNPPGKRTGYKLIVENLSTRTSWQDLKDYMRQAGEIMYTNTHHIRSGEGIGEFGSRSRSRSRSRGGRGGRDRDHSKEESRSRSRSRSARRSNRSRSRSRSNRSRS